MCRLSLKLYNKKKEYCKLTHLVRAYIIRDIRRGFSPHIEIAGGGITMKKSGKLLSVLLMIGIMINTVPLVSMAARTTSISSVTIRVGTDSSAGDYLPMRPTAVNDSTDNQSGTYAAAVSTKYTVDDVDWVSSSATDRVLAVGDEPKMVVTLRSTGYVAGDREYIFRGGYSSSNVNVKGGTFVSARVRDGGDTLEVTVRLRGIKGSFPTPTIAEWINNSLGQARWGYEDSEDRKGASGFYDVYLFRGNSIVTKLESYEGTSCNFYPYMAKEGTYSYKVRAVAGTDAQRKYGSKSDWTQSDEIYVDKQHVSDGSGQNGQPGVNNGQVGWIQQNGTWYYRYPDGTYQRDSWAKVNDKWYLFDSNAKMLTGWQNKNGRYYFMDQSGAMQTGWLQNGGKWYYLNTDPTGQEGMMMTGWIQVNGQAYYLDGSGVMVEGWYKVGDSWYYFWPKSGNKATNTTIEGFYVDNNGIWKK